MHKMEPLRSGIEYDYLTKAKRFFSRNPGVRKYVKRVYNKRLRRVCGIHIKKENYDAIICQGGPIHVGC